MERDGGHLEITLTSAWSAFIPTVLHQLRASSVVRSGPQDHE